MGRCSIRTSQFFGELLQSRWLVESRRQIQYGGHFHLGIDDALAFRHRSRQSVPSGGDVLQNGFEALALRLNWHLQGRLEPFAVDRTTPQKTRVSVNPRRRVLKKLVIIRGKTVALTS